MEQPGRLPPQDLDAELSVLGGLVVDSDKWGEVNAIISASDLYRQSHKYIFNAIGSLISKEEPVDLLLLNSELKNMGVLEESGGTGFIARIADGVVTTANITYYANIIKEKAVARNVISISQTAIASLYDDGNVVDVVDALKQSAMGVSFDKGDVKVHTMKEVIMSSFQAIEEAHEKGEPIVGVPYGFAALDRFTAGAMPGDLIVVAGRPGMGKSLFTGEVVINAAHNGYPSVLFSAEMLMQQYGKKVLSSRARVLHTRTRTGKIEESDWGKLTKAAGFLSEKKVFIVDKGGLTLSEIISTSEKLKMKHDIKAIAVDYLQLIKMKKIPGVKREEEVSKISYEMKSLAKRLEVPVYLLSQLNREVEKRPDKRPIMSDLRESGSIEQDADVVILLYRPEEYFTDGDIDRIYKGWGREKPSTIKDLLECIIAKGRDIETGTVFLKSEMRYQSISDLNPMGF
jgi:replicative DNA helicase